MLRLHITKNSHNLIQVQKFTILHGNTSEGRYERVCAHHHHVFFSCFAFHLIFFLCMCLWIWWFYTCVYGTVCKCVLHRCAFFVSSYLCLNLRITLCNADRARHTETHVYKHMYVKRAHTQPHTHISTY